MCNLSEKSSAVALPWKTIHDPDSQLAISAVLGEPTVHVREA